MAHATAGSVDEAAGTVTVPATTHVVTIRLRRLALQPAATSLRIDPAGSLHVGPAGSAVVTATFADSGVGAVRGVQLRITAPAG